MRSFPAIFVAAFSGFLSALAVASPPPVTTYHNDTSRDGVNSSETTLNVLNVNTTSFGKLYSLAVDGQVYAQPLYVPAVNITGGIYPGIHNVLYVATMNNTIYALDADSATEEILWSRNLGTPVPCSQLGQYCSSSNLKPSIGILSTPVIDLTNDSIYVVAETSVSSTTAQFSLHSLNITTGAEKANSPVVISGAVPGTTSYGGNGTTLPFDPNWHWQRTGLTLLRGNIYFGFGSIGDVGPWHGWLFGYNETTLNRVVIKCMSPDYYGNAIWQGGAAFAADNASNIYFATSNGSFNASTGGTEWGEALIKMNTVTNTFTSYFAPSNEVTLDLNDLDLGGAGPIILPSVSPLVAPMIVTGGKSGEIYLLNTANLKGYNPADEVIQEFQSLTHPFPAAESLRFGGSVFYNNALFTWGSGDPLKRWAFTGSSFLTTPTSTSAYQAPADYSNPASMSLSSNGTASNTAVLWALTPELNTGSAGTLRAYNAANLSTELWDSNQRGSLDAAGTWSKFAPPTVVNGKVYVPTLDGAVNVFGLLAH